MDDILGGADYKKSHQMIFGNLSYDEKGKTSDSHDLEILSYFSKVNEKYNLKKATGIEAYINHMRKEM